MARAKGQGNRSLGVRRGCDVLTFTNPLPALSCVDRPVLRPLITNTTEAVERRIKGINVRPPVFFFIFVG